MKQPLSRPLETALIGKLINSPRINNFSLKVAGKSMRPFLIEGDTVNCRKFIPNPWPKFGQIMVIWGNDILIHRVIGIKHDKSGFRVLTKGDFRLEADGWIPKERLIAVVAGKEGGGEFRRIEEILIGILSLGIYLMPNFFKSFLRKLKKSTKLADSINR